MALAFKKRIIPTAVALVLLLSGAPAEAARKKAPAKSAPPIDYPAATPGSVQERGYAVDAEGTIMERLGFVLRMYAYGMRRYIEDASAATPGTSGRVSEASVEVFARQLRVATFAYFEYTYVENGVTRTREFISRSNRGMERFILRGTTNLTAPGQSDAAYLESNDVVRFVHDSQPVEESHVMPRRDGAVNRENDAEMKVLQQLMREIRANPAMRGGTLVGYVSQQPCESCTPALRHFARETAANVRVNYVYGGAGPGHETALWRALRQAREGASALLLARFVKAPDDGAAPR